MRQPELSETERVIWQKAYTLHEEFCQGDWTVAKGERLAKRVMDLDEEANHHPLMRELIYALYMYFDILAKEQYRAEPEQMTMGVPM